MDAQLHGILLGAFAADSLALGAHWEYDQNRISENLGDVRELLAPTLNEYHPGKRAGDLSHYGDQALWLLRFVVEHGRFDAPGFTARWRDNMRTYTGYRDHASKDTLHNMEQGKEPSGAETSDFAGPARLVALLPAHPLRSASPERLAAFLADAAAQTRITHNTPLLADVAAFLGYSLHALCNGATSMAEAFAAAAEVSYAQLPAKKWLAAAESRLDQKPNPTVQAMGQACGVPGAMLATLYLAEKYENDPVEGLIRNVMAGGDSCARGFMLGALYGACNGEEWIPPSWRKALAVTDEIGRIRSVRTSS